MAYYYHHRVLAVPTKGYENDYQEFKQLLEESVENEDFSELEEIMELDEDSQQFIETSEDFFIETKNEYCQFFIYSRYSPENVRSDAYTDLASRFKLTVYHCYGEETDNRDGSGIGIYYVESIDEDGEVEIGTDYVEIDENGINDDSWYNIGGNSGSDLNDILDMSSDKADRMLARICNLAWDYGYDDDDDPDYSYESSSDTLQCFKIILRDLGMRTEAPGIPTGSSVTGEPTGTTLNNSLADSLTSSIDNLQSDIDAQLGSINSDLDNLLEDL